MLSSRLISAATLLVVIGTGSIANGHATAQQANPLVGVWTIVSVNNERPDGSKVPLFGSNPSGLLVFDAQGRYSLQLCAAGRPKFAAKDRNKGTPEEYQAAVVGCNPHWGRYTFNEAEKTIVFEIDHAIFTNWEGTQQKRSFTITDEMLKYAVPNPSEGAANPVVIWKRAP